MKRILVPALLTLPCLPAAAGAQTVEGRLLDAATGAAYVQTYVLLVDSAGHEVARTLTGPEGRFELEPAFPGAYRVLAERIGFSSVPSGWISVADSPGALEIDPGFTPIELPAATSPAPACHPQDGPEHLYWTEVRKALGEAVATVRRGDLHYQVRVFERELGTDEVVRRELGSTLDDLIEVPFAAASAAGAYRTVDSEGTVSYFAPDPETLLGPDFERVQCFRIVSGPDGRTGLAFARETETGITGTFWLRPGTSELAELDFRYVASEAGLETAGGSVAFGTPAPGDWIIQSWWLSLPIIRRESDSGVTVTGSTRVGAHTLDVRRSDGTPVFDDWHIAVLEGTVYDSVNGAPLQGAVAALAGTRHWTVTDDDGRFFLAEHLEGRYRLVFGHPRLDSIGFVADPVTLELHRGAESRVALTVPSMRSILEAQCGPRADEGMRILAGVVHDARTGRPVDGAVVSVSRELVPDRLRRFASSAANNVAVTDSLGRYTFCGVPPGQTVTVIASAEERSSDFVTVEFGQDSVSIGGRGSLPLAVPVARLDLLLLESELHTGQVAGYVVEDATGRPVAGATVSIDGTVYATQTDSAGAFALSGTPSGEVNIAIRKFGYQMLRHTVSVSPGAVAVLSSNVLRMREVNSEAYVLDPITVEARRAATHAVTGFEERRSSRFGSFLTREEFEKWHPTQATDVLRRMRGVSVVPNGSYGINGDTRRYLIIPTRDIGQRITQLITTNAERAANNLGSTEYSVNECPVLLFLDGVFLGDSRTANVDNFISIVSLGAVEVYSASQVPPRFALPGSTCGVVLFWSR